MLLARERGDLLAHVRLIEADAQDLEALVMERVVRLRQVRQLGDARAPSASPAQTGSPAATQGGSPSNHVRERVLTVVSERSSEVPDSSCIRSLEAKRLQGQHQEIRKRRRKCVRVREKTRTVTVSGGVRTSSNEIAAAAPSPDSAWPREGRPVAYPGLEASQDERSPPVRGRSVRMPHSVPVNAPMVTSVHNGVKPREYFVRCFGRSDRSAQGGRPSFGRSDRRAPPEHSASVPGRPARTRKLEKPGWRRRSVSAVGSARLPLSGWARLP
jgi:hypothetical protein